MTGITGAGLDKDELDLIQHELKMDLEAEQDEDDDAEMLDSNNDGLVMSSTICDSLPHYFSITRSYTSIQTHCACKEEMCYHKENIF